MIEKKKFRLYKLEEEEGKPDYSKSIWFNKEMRELIYSVGCHLRQYQLSTIIKQALEIAEANLIVNEKITEICYGNGMRNKRKGFDDIEGVKKELNNILGNSVGLK